MHDGSLSVDRVMHVNILWSSVIRYELRFSLKNVPPLEGYSRTGVVVLDRPGGGGEEEVAVGWAGLLDQREATP